MKKRPEGKAFDEFVERWHNADHAGKVEMAEEYERSYDTLKHWVSDRGNYGNCSRN